LVDIPNLWLLLPTNGLYILFPPVFFQQNFFPPWTTGIPSRSSSWQRYRRKRPGTACGETCWKEAPEPNAIACFMTLKGDHSGKMHKKMLGSMTKTGKPGFYLQRIHENPLQSSTNRGFEHGILWTNR